VQGRLPGIGIAQVICAHLTAKYIGEPWIGNLSPFSYKSCQGPSARLRRCACAGNRQIRRAEPANQLTRKGSERRVYVARLLQLATRAPLTFCHRNYDGREQFLFGDEVVVERPLGTPRLAAISAMLVPAKPFLRNVSERWQ